MAAPLKDHLGPRTVEVLAERLAGAHPDFDPSAFVAAVAEQLADLELKERVNLLADAIAAGLPDDYPDALRAVVRVAEDELDEWAAWPLCSFVERHGVDHPIESLNAMETLTIRWSCEFALRPFLEAHLDLTRGYLRQWTSHPNEAVRRLASEGTRPLLPWGPRVAALADDPRVGTEVLQALRHDPSATVRRSVANHLNDISRSQPDLVVDLLAGWIDSTEPLDQRMVSHALRTMVKRGDQRALRLLGFTTDPTIEVTGFSCSPSRINLGAGIELVAEIESTSADNQLLVIDFVIHHVTASGGTSPKVFKWKNLTLAAGRTSRLSKVRRIEPASTRRYHSGYHRIDLQVAGRTVASTGFMLGAV